MLFIFAVIVPLLLILHGTQIILFRILQDIYLGRSQSATMPYMHNFQQRRLSLHRILKRVDVGEVKDENVADRDLSPDMTHVFER